MTTTFIDRFNAGMDGLEHISTGSYMEQCTECPLPCDGFPAYEDGVSYQAEPYFSWSACELCDSGLGGNREDAHAIYDGSLIHLRICTDCVAYLANGELPEA